MEEERESVVFRGGRLHLMSEDEFKNQKEENGRSDEKTKTQLRSKKEGKRLTEVRGGRRSMHNITLPHKSFTYSGFH